MPKIGMRLQVNPPAVSRIPARYDEHVAASYDFSKRIKPQSDIFNLINLKSVRESFGMEAAMTGIKAVAIADINLKTRGLIGMVLGSCVKDLYDYNEYNEQYFMECLSGHSDFDVLIMQKHSDRDPKPFEWGIDWWIRPEPHRPTNGNTSLIYDLSLDAHCCSTSTNPNEDDTFFAFSINPYEPSITMRYVPQLVRMVSDKLSEENDGRICIPPGLYLPPTEVMDKIYIAAVRSNSHKSYEHLRVNKTTGTKPFLPVIPARIVKFESNYLL